MAGGAQLVGVRLARVLEDVADDDGGALLGEPAAVCGALSAGAAGDERGPAREPRVIRGSPGTCRVAGLGAAARRPRPGAAEHAVDAPLRAVHVALPLVARDVDPRLGPGAAREARRQLDAGALLGRQELGDQSAWAE